MPEEQKTAKSAAAPEQHKFPSEVIDLPSAGKIYPKDHPLTSGKVEIKYMTAKEEDILTSQNLIKKGLVIDKLLDSIILTPGVSVSDMFVGDKNAIMIAARILAYGSEYKVEIQHPETEERVEHTFDLSSIDYKTLDDSVTSNSFEVELPASKSKVKFKLLTGSDERAIDDDLKSLQKIGVATTREITTRLKHLIIEVDGDTDRGVINSFVENMLARDSLHLRKSIQKITPDIDLSQDIDIGGETVRVDIPLTVEFFWPSTELS